MPLHRDATSGDPIGTQHAKEPGFPERIGPSSGTEQDPERSDPLFSLSSSEMTPEIEANRGFQTMILIDTRD